MLTSACASGSGVLQTITEWFCRHDTPAMPPLPAAGCAVPAGGVPAGVRAEPGLWARSPSGGTPRCWLAAEAAGAPAGGTQAAAAAGAAGQQQSDDGRGRQASSGRNGSPRRDTNAARGREGRRGASRTNLWGQRKHLVTGGPDLTRKLASMCVNQWRQCTRRAPHRKKNQAEPARLGGSEGVQGGTRERWQGGSPRVTAAAPQLPRTAAAPA
jgi:hypothetical protein